jgi:hypothetical protein
MTVFADQLAPVGVATPRALSSAAAAVADSVLSSDKIGRNASACARAAARLAGTMSLKDKLIKIGAKVVSHGRYVIFQMAEAAIASRAARSARSRADENRSASDAPEAEPKNAGAGALVTNAVTKTTPNNHRDSAA